MWFCLVAVQGDTFRVRAQDNDKTQLGTGSPSQPNATLVVAVGSRTQCPELPWNARGVTKCALGPRGKNDTPRSVRVAARAQARMGTAAPDGHAFVGEPRKRVHQTRPGEGVKIAIFLL